METESAESFYEYNRLKDIRDLRERCVDIAQRWLNSDEEFQYTATESIVVAEKFYQYITTGVIPVKEDEDD